MTNQQHADAALQAWQSLRALPPEDRIDALMALFFLPPLASDFEYEITLKALSDEMAAS